MCAVPKSKPEARRGQTDVYYESPCRLPRQDGWDGVPSSVPVPPSARPGPSPSPLGGRWKLVSKS